MRLPLLALAFACSIFAQGFGTISGTVTDASGAVVPSANITVTESATGLFRSAKSNAQGIYTIPELRPATYSLQV